MVLFSIVCAVRNAEATIGPCLESILAQSDPPPASAVLTSGQTRSAAPEPFDDYEVIVVDGASSDDTVSVAESYRARLGGRLTVVSEPDDGVYDAMNRGLTRATGEYVLFLNDDRLTPGALALVAGEIEGRPDFIGGAVWLQPAASSASAPRLATPFSSILAERFPRAMPACHQAIYARRAILMELGGFDTRYRIASDYDLTVRARELGATWALTNEPLAHYALGGLSANGPLLIREYRDIALEHGANKIRVWARYLRQRVRDAIASW